MKMPYTKSGKCGDTVWQWNGHAQTSYPYYVPYDPRTPAQVTLRTRFGAISARWSTLTGEQRASWRAAAKRQRTRRRLGQSWPLNGFIFFMRVNLHQANQGLAPADLPPAQPPPPRDAVAREPQCQPECPNRAGASASFTFPGPGMAEAGGQECFCAGLLTGCLGSPLWFYPEEVAALRPRPRDTS